MLTLGGSMLAAEEAETTYWIIKANILVSGPHAKLLVYNLAMHFCQISLQVSEMQIDRKFVR